MVGSIGALYGPVSPPGGGAQIEMFGGAPVEDRRRGRGRPLGSHNLHSQKIATWILGHYDNPLEGLAAMSLPADMLQIVEKAISFSDTLECSRKEAIELMMRASDMANRYLNSPPPVAVNVNTKQTMLAIGVGAPPTAANAQGGLDALRAMMLERAADRSAADRKADGEVIEAIAEIVQNQPLKNLPGEEVSR